MTPQDYDAWYDTPRGRWIGEREWSLVRAALDPGASDTLLDVGCGTGWFTRRAAGVAATVVGVDIDEASLDFARRKDPDGARYLFGDAVRLPFADRSFDKVMSVAALCFVADWPRALAEVVRVARHRFAVGLLNRNSVLYLRKGRGAGVGAYRGAHWHTRGELAAALRMLPAADLRFAYAVFAPGGGPLARLADRVLPETLALGSFLLVVGARAPR